MDFNKPDPLNLTSGNVTLNFTLFKEEALNYLTATETDTKTRTVQVARLKNLLGPDARKAYAATNPFTALESIESIFDAIEEQCLPKKNETMAMYTFQSRKQFSAEPFERFYTDLRTLIKPCDFQSLESKILKSQIILGISSLSLRERLLREDLTLEKVVSLCKAAEASEHNLQVLNSNSSCLREDVHATTTAKYTPSFPPSPSRSSKPNPPTKNQFRQPNKNKCFYCGFVHYPNQQCPAIGATCSFCGVANHFATVCRKRLKPAPKSSDELRAECANMVELNTEDTVDSLNFSIDTVYSKYHDTNDQWFTNLFVNDQSITFKLDSGASANILSHHAAKKCGLQKICPTNVKLITYGGHELTPLGTVQATIRTQRSSITDTFIVLSLDCTPILGLPTCKKLNLIKKCDEICNNPPGTFRPPSKEEFLETNADVFNGLGCFPGLTTFKVKEGSEPKINPPRRVPLQIKDRLKQSLDTLEKNGIIEKVEQPTGWVSNLVVIEKPNKTLRICIDPTELNKVIIRDYYEIPKFEEIMTSLSKMKFYCVFDLKDGYYHLKLDAATSDLCTVSTPFGCYKFLRAPFGITSIPEIFQKKTSQYFGDIPGVEVYFDDILSSGQTEEDLFRVVQMVLQRAREYGVKFNPTKLQYFAREVNFFGNVICEGSCKPNPDRVKAIETLKDPCNKKELQQALGMVNYLSKFVPHLSEKLQPFRTLLKLQDNNWLWTDQHSANFQSLKDIISKAATLTLFDPTKDVSVQCDASQNALGSCLMQDGNPIYYASRCLTETEQNYAQIEKELLSVCFAMEKFHNLIYGLKISVFNDHKPLVYILNKPFDKIKNNRLRRLRLKLLPYDLTLHYVPGPKLVIADFLSRNCSLKSNHDTAYLTDVVHTIETLSLSPLKEVEYKNATAEDTTLSKLSEWYKLGWPKKNTFSGDLHTYFALKNNITVSNGLVYMDNRLIVPTALRIPLLHLLHETHLSFVKTLPTAKQNFYWPKLSSELYNFIATCSTCNKYSRTQIRHPLLSHEIPAVPFAKIGLDLAKENGSFYLILMDYYSRWLEIEPLSNPNSAQIIEKLKRIFSAFGIPQKIVCDNSPFNSQEFHDFAHAWNIELIFSSPYHPRSNGLAEKAVGIAKNMIKKSRDTKVELHLYLLNYRNAIIANTGFTPSQLLMNRQLRTKLPVQSSNLSPNQGINHAVAHQKMLDNQQSQKSHYDKSARTEVLFWPGERILLQNPKTKLWENAKIVKKLPEPRSYLVETQFGFYRRNSSLLRKTPSFEIEDTPAPTTEAAGTANEPEPLRRSSRIRRVPERLNYSKKGGM